ncbi:hypothetical protein [Nocardioides sp.]|nr:hypothetical protein [Nocardioides sp.]HSX65936.1 hypothetical protein [Nocardioides sp.]
MLKALSGIAKPMPFCRLCVRYMTPQEAKKHSEHAKAIKWPKK